ncbi:phosphate signaling complex protein PhoU [Bacillus niameyensis]|uniref:phosphate signaling complex protein PhoU n=1 Tax=Bacillus niameyensis TaxID=1522308 RepID=UPI000A647480|nr:phosphate signaling complex protein PhoU [Bacillus niameyensis]
MVTRSQFEEQLQKLHGYLLKMGTMVEESVHNAVRSLIHKDVKLAHQVMIRDKEINQAEMEIEKICLNLIALQQPVGSDLRKIITALKVSTDLERMGDHAVNIAETTIKLQNEIYAKPLIDIPKMAELVKRMIRDVLEAYIEVNQESAVKIADKDDEVDSYYQKVFNDLVRIMNEEKMLINQASHLLLVAQYLERIGDYVTNICESIIYLSSGESVELN